VPISIPANTASQKCGYILKSSLTLDVARP
jgi:hypothetical protein